MVGAPGSNHATGHHLLLLCDRVRRFPQHPSYCCRAQVQTRTREYLGDLNLAHHGTKGLQSLHRVAHEVREPIDRLAKLQERSWALLVDPLCPGRNRCWREQKGEQMFGSLQSRIQNEVSGVEPASILAPSGTDLLTKGGQSVCIWGVSRGYFGPPSESLSSHSPSFNNSLNDNFSKTR